MIHIPTETDRPNLPKWVVYPGSFDLWHVGHQDILDKALRIYDGVIVLQMQNQDKGANSWPEIDLTSLGHRVRVIRATGLLVDQVNDLRESGHNVVAVIRGLRNSSDLQYETNQQYWNEDLKLAVPITFLITDRRYGHISSSAIKKLATFKKDSK